MSDSEPAPEHIPHVARHSEPITEIARAASEPMAVLDRAMRYVATSRAWAELFDRSDLEGLSPDEVRPEVPPPWRDAHRRGLAGEQVRGRDASLDLRDGTHRWLDWSLTPWRDDTGAVRGTWLTAHDVTERRRAQLALAESEARHHTLVEASPDAFMVHVDEHIVYANRVAATLFGARDVAELLGRRIHDLVDESLGPQLDERARAHARGEKLAPIVVRTRPISGEARDVEIHATPTTFGGRPAVYGVARDVTDARRLARERAESEARFGELAEHIDEVFTISDGTRATYLSPAFDRIFGLPRAEAMADPDWWRALVHPDDRSRATEMRARLDAYDEEYRIVRPSDGALRWIRSRGRPVRDAAGTIVRKATVSEDVTDRKRAEEGRRESEERYRHLVEDSPEAIFVHVDRRIVYANTASEHLFGAPVSALLGKHVSELLAPQHHAAAAGRQAAFDRKEVLAPFVVTTSPISGEPREVEVRAFATRFDGEPAVQVLCRDVTDVRQLTRAREESEERYRRLVEASPDAIFVHQERRIVYANAASLRLFGASDVSELLGRLVWDVLDPSVHALVAPRLDTLDRDKTVSPRFLIKTRTLAGEARDAEVSATATVFDGRPAIQAMMRDVTDERRNARAAREHEARLAAIVSSAMDAILSADESHTIVLANPAAERLFGYGPGGLLGTPIDKLVPPRFRVRHAAAMEHFVTSGATTRHMVGGTLLGLHADGTEIPLEASVSKTDVDGRALFTVMHRDLRPRLAFEAAARESDERFRELAEQTDQVFALSSADRKRLLYLSPAFERVFGMTRDEVLAHPERFSGLVHPDDRAGVIAQFASRDPYEAEYRIVRPDGAIRHIRARVRPLRDAAGDVTRVVSVAEDVTERRALEAQLQQSQKLESIGRLAGGVAHDFNNLLTVMTGASEILHEAHLPPEVDGLLEEIEDAAQRGATLTRQLLSFSRQDILERRDVDLGVLVDDALRLLRRLIGENVQVTHVRREPARVHVDPGQWDQVLVNLVVNARDAMPKGGSVRVETGRVVLAHGDARFPDAPSGPYALLRVADTGEGMPPHVRARIFEPFFTTKPRQQGTGLGLAVVYGIVKQAGGHVHVASEPGRGTTFSIAVPLTSSQTGTPATSSARLRAATGGGETILVVEDDEAVRRVAARALTQYGYQVLQAPDGEAALAVLAQHQVQLVLTDVVMPHLDGPSLVRSIRERWPRCKVLLSTGYAETSLDARELSEHPVLRKPYTKHMLCAKVREVLRS